MSVTDDYGVLFIKTWLTYFIWQIQLQLKRNYHYIDYDS